MTKQICCRTGRREIGLATLGFESDCAGCLATGVGIGLQNGRDYETVCGHQQEKNGGAAKMATRFFTPATTAQTAATLPG